MVVRAVVKNGVVVVSFLHVSVTTHTPAGNSLVVALNSLAGLCDDDTQKQVVSSVRLVQPVQQMVRYSIVHQVAVTP
uniref:Uncharacterized protein n=1 Tax=Arion vulgaris TaxID=1028688 RepID=A0A0B6ZKR5_9EUPU